MSAITPIVMPKWGLEMREGTISAWLVENGTRITVGQPHENARALEALAAALAATRSAAAAG